MNKENADVLIEAEKSFCKMAFEEGFYKAILFYADDNMVKLNDGQFPIVGKASLAESFGEKAGTKKLSWEPVKAEIASSGDLGYTYGNWKLQAADTTYYGNYFTVWKKQSDGKWKVALDGGNSTPAPVVN